MKSSSRKAKGRRLQKYLAEKIAELTGLECGKDCPVESRPMGQTGCDIRLDSTARARFPYSVECKNTENWNLPSAIEQAQANCYPGTDWLVCLSKNNQRPVVVLDAEAFFSLLSKLKQLRSRK